MVTLWLSAGIAQVEGSAQVDELWGIFHRRVCTGLGGRNIWKELYRGDQY